MYSQFDSKRTKIVATVGPSSSTPDKIRAMIHAGVNVFRINFSHGNHETHGAVIDLIRQIVAEEGVVAAILCDIQGPKIRIGTVANEPLALSQGQRITFTTQKVPGENGLISLPHPEFMQDIKAGMKLLLDDGNVEMVVKQVISNGMIAEVVNGRELKSRKGISAPQAEVSLSAITAKDREDIEFALSKEADFIAMSFVRTAEDIRQMRWLMTHLNGEAAVIAKVEKPQALVNIQEIIDVSDGIMVARGDLGIETPAEEVPYQQKRIIKLCNEAGKPVITATQMLSTMEINPRPTRAEASDVYNAILDGTDAVMLSNETAAGNYPLEAVEMMSKIARIAESRLREQRNENNVTNPNKIATKGSGREAISDAVSQAACQIAESIGCRAIVTTTVTGYTSRHVAKERPITPILCVTPNLTVYRRMALVWGVHPLLIPFPDTLELMFDNMIEAIQNNTNMQVGDTLAVLAGVPFGVGGQTNFLRIHTIGE